MLDDSSRRSSRTSTPRVSDAVRSTRARTSGEGGSSSLSSSGPALHRPQRVITATTQGPDRSPFIRLKPGDPLSGHCVRPARLERLYRTRGLPRSRSPRSVLGPRASARRPTESRSHVAGAATLILRRAIRVPHGHAETTRTRAYMVDRPGVFESEMLAARERSSRLSHAGTTHVVTSESMFFDDDTRAAVVFKVMKAAGDGHHIIIIGNRASHRTSNASSCYAGSAARISALVESRPAFARPLPPRADRALGHGVSAPRCARDDTTPPRTLYEAVWKVVRPPDGANGPRKENSSWLRAASFQMAGGIWGKNRRSIFVTRRRPAT